MEKAKIDRINELGRISKVRELTEDEKKEIENKLLVCYHG